MKALRTHTPAGVLRFAVPDGGLFLWCRLDGQTSAQAVQRRALSQSVFIVTGEPFYADGGGRHQLRLCFTTRPPELGARAAKIVAESVVAVGRQPERAQPASRIV